MSSVIEWANGLPDWWFGIGSFLALACAVAFFFVLACWIAERANHGRSKDARQMARVMLICLVGGPVLFVGVPFIFPALLAVLLVFVIRDAISAGR